MSKGNIPSMHPREVRRLCLPLTVQGVVINKRAAKNASAAGSFSSATAAQTRSLTPHLIRVPLRRLSDRGQSASVDSTARSDG